MIDSTLIRFIYGVIFYITNMMFYRTKRAFIQLIFIYWIIYVCELGNVQEVDLGGAQLKLLKDKEYPSGYANLAIDKNISTCVHANISKNGRIRLNIISAHQLDISGIAIMNYNQGMECRYTELGTEYRGSQNTTKSGRSCQNWNFDSPHSHSHSGDNLERNYCRNPDNTPGGPWCFTTDRATRWESCGIPICVGLNQPQWIDRMEIKVSNDSSIKNSTVCNTYNGSFPESGEAVVWCNRVLTGKYIWFINREPISLLHICEIKIYGKTSYRISKRISTAQNGKEASVDSSYDMYSSTEIHTIDNTIMYSSPSSRYEMLSSTMAISDVTKMPSASASDTSFVDNISTGRSFLDSSVKKTISPNMASLFTDLGTKIHSIDRTGMYSSPSSRNELSSSTLGISDVTKILSSSARDSLLSNNGSTGRPFLDSSVKKTISPNTASLFTDLGTKIHSIDRTGMYSSPSSRNELSSSTLEISDVTKMLPSSARDSLLSNNGSTGRPFLETSIKTTTTPYKATVTFITASGSEMKTYISNSGLETYNSSFLESLFYSSLYKTSLTTFPTSADSASVTTTSPYSANTSTTVPTSTFTASPQTTTMLTSTGLTTPNVTSFVPASTSYLPVPSANYTTRLNASLTDSFDTVVTAGISGKELETPVSSFSILEIYNISFLEPSFYSSSFKTSITSFSSQDVSSPVTSSINVSSTFSLSTINLTMIMFSTSALSTETEVLDTSVIIKNDSVMTASSLSSVFVSSSSMGISPSRPVTEPPASTKKTTESTIVPTTTDTGRPDNRKGAKSVVTPVVVSLVVILAIGGIIVFALLYRKKILSTVFKGKEKHDEEGVVLTPIINKPNNHPAAPPINGIEKRHFRMMDFKPSLSNPIAVTDLHKHISMKRKGNIFSKEFSSFPSGMVLPRDVGSLENDHSRVVLGDRDYINANYVDSFDRQQAYIATQGPLQKTIGDFWKMIWQENVGKIVMLTNLEEQRKIKCHKYWPSKSKKIKVENLIVSLDRDEEYPIFSLRKMTLAHEITNKTKQVTQFHFTVWPDHGVPGTFQLLLFHDWVVNYPSHMKGPTVVHCSAGVGRTGTYIALDALKSSGLLTEEVDVYLYVEYMRKCRVNMVQTLEQYMFIHDVLMEYFVCPDSMCDTELLKDSWYYNDIISQNQRLTMEFQILDSLRPKYFTSQYSEALKEENIRKNRSSHILAVNECRVELDTGGEGSDYINAVVLPSMSKKKGYFVTEIPVECMQSSFWQMVYDFNSNIVILLDSPEESQEVFYPTNEATVSFKPYNITRTSCKTENDSIGREYLTVTNEKYEEKSEVLLLTVPNCVSDNDVPDLMLSLHVETKKWQEGKGEEFITVVCRDGATHCGLFCAVSNIIDCIDHYDKVDLLKTVRQLQICRPEILQQEAQYKYCLQSALLYADSLDHTYVNA